MVHRAVLGQRDEFHSTICPAGIVLSTRRQPPRSAHAAEELLLLLSYLSSTVQRVAAPAVVTATFLPAPECPGKDVAMLCPRVLSSPRQSLALLFPSNSARRRGAGVLWGYLRRQCQICAPTHQSLLSSSVIRPMLVPYNLMKARPGEEGTSCLLARREHKAAAAAAVTAHIKAVISLPVQSPSGDKALQTLLAAARSSDSCAARPCRGVEWRDDPSLLCN